MLLLFGARHTIFWRQPNKWAEPCGCARLIGRQIILSKLCDDNQFREKNNSKWVANKTRSSHSTIYIYICDKRWKLWTPFTRQAYRLHRSFLLRFAFFCMLLFLFVWWALSFCALSVLFPFDFHSTVVFLEKTSQVDEMLAHWENDQSSELKCKGIARCSPSFKKRNTTDFAEIFAGSRTTPNIYIQRHISHDLCIWYVVQRANTITNNRTHTHSVLPSKMESLWKLFLSLCLPSWKNLFAC